MGTFDKCMEGLDALTFQLGELIPDDRVHIDEHTSFLDWAEQLGREGLTVDGHPFDLSNRPALRAVYGMIPNTPNAFYDRGLVVMKGAQTGLTVMSFLLQIYIALKYGPGNVGAYYPDRLLAGTVSRERFMPVLQSVPEAYALLRESSDSGDGNVLVRRLGKSRLYFLWTSGAMFTESIPLLILCLDEVQGMLVSDIERTMERLSASHLKWFFMFSTAKWPDADIDYFYKRGSMHEFWSDCECPDGVILESFFPECIQLNDGLLYPDAPQDYIYVCPHCNIYIADAQKGKWVPKVVDADHDSVHFPQTLSPTVTPRQMIKAWQDADDLQNYYNRKRGKPYTDPSQVPVNFTHLLACVEEGTRVGIQWLKSATGTYMGIDQMGAFNVAIIKARLPDGRQAVVHVEAIYDDDPFARCDELMEQYGVVVCVVETLPNYNDAKRFAGRHLRKVFLVGSYGQLEDGMMAWGDAIVTKADRKTALEERDRYTVRLDQYKCMQVSMSRFTGKTCLFPDPKGLEQDVIEKGMKKRIALLKDMVFLHFTRTALVTVKDEEERKYRRKVVKVGLDPHFSYANMLCDVAWARAYGTTTIYIPQSGDYPMKSSNTKSDREKVKAALPNMGVDVLAAISDKIAGVDNCGVCQYREGRRCTLRGYIVKTGDEACGHFIRGEYEQ